MKRGGQFFFPLLERGVDLRGCMGCRLRDFLKARLTVDDPYRDQRIQTLFLNGRPVDDLDAHWIKNGDRLALSAAMPGLAGATLRRDGALAVPRKEITIQCAHASDAEAIGIIELRAYNLLLGELAPHLFSAGVWVKGERLAAFIASRMERITTATEIYVNENPPVAPGDRRSFENRCAERHEPVHGA